MDELEELSCITGGSLELSDSSDLGASGSLDFVGNVLPSSNDMIRIYYNFTDEAGSTQSVALGTLFTILSDPTYDMQAVSGSISLQSILRVAKASKVPFPYSVPRFTNACARGVQMLQQLGIPTNNASANYQVGRGVCFDFGTDKLEIINALFKAAGLSSCSPDAMGGVVVAPLTDGTKNSPVWTFKEGALSIMKPEVVLANGSADTPNAVHLRYQDDGHVLWASAYNQDSASEASIPSRGYEVSYCEETKDIEGDSSEARLDALKALASSTLIRETGGTEYVEFQHPWVPLWPGNTVAIKYDSAKIDWVGKVSTMKFDFDASGLMVTTRAKRLTELGFSPTIEGGRW